MRWCTLQRLFSTFPSGRAGVGLLLLRAAIGLTGTLEGVWFVADRARPPLEAWGIGLALAGSGVLLLIGFLTPIASAAVCLVSAAMGASWFPTPTANPFNGPLPMALLVAVAAAVALLGPGSLSLDCRMFGRREIIIPRVRH